jgi:DNA-binding NtrC family response regulator
MSRVARLVRGLGCAAEFVGSEEPADMSLLLACGATAVPGAERRLQQAQSLQAGVLRVALVRGLACAELERLLAAGAVDYAPLDSPDDELLLRLRRVLGLLAAPHPAAQVVALPAVFQTLRQRLVGRSATFVRVVQRIPAMAASDASVLLLGETGTGKEVCAQAIHYCSPRARGPWVAINCAAIPPELVEDELFGHVRGAYTHAVGARKGLVAEAEGGTLFLDEIDSMPPAVQAKLLRFLQDKQYRMLGSSAVLQADVRVVAASNRDLRRAAERGQFRQDLFYRLNVLALTLPPLRERAADLPMLAQHFLDLANRESGRHLAGLTPAAMRRLCAHAWPGNVRELRNVLHRAVLLAQGLMVQPADIELDDDPPALAGAKDESELSFREAKARTVEAFERHYLEELLLHSEGNITRAARTARKNRRALFELLRRHEIDAAAFRTARA